MEPEEITSQLDSGAEKLNSAVSGLNTSIDKFTNILSALSGSSTNSPGSDGATASVEKMKSQVESFGEIIKKFGIQGDQAKRMAQELSGQISKINTSGVNKNFKEFQDTGSSAFNVIKNAFNSTVNFMNENSDKIKSALGGAAIKLGGAAIKEMLEKFDNTTGILTAEKSLRALEQQALQTNMSLEGIGPAANTSINSYIRSIQESIRSTNSNKEAVMAVKKSLGEAFSTDQMDTVLRLSGAYDNFQGSLTATNAALLIGKAVGLESTVVSKFMADAALQLGEDTDGAVAALGRIQQSSEKSGIGFNNTMNSIKASTEALKMWGGTIGGVAPLFDMFSKSLKGTGREGLTPELLGRMASGLAGMSTSTKALLGIQGGLNMAGGAIGGSLEIEAAMEDKSGAGMKKIMDSLTQTLTQFGGGRIITREEAIRDPAAQNNFMVQRQLLMQILKMDESTANRTLNALAGVDENGLDITNVAEQKLGELVGMGDKIAKETTDPMLTALNSLEATEIDGNKAIIESLGTLAGKLDLKEVFQGGIEAILQVISSGGKAPIRDIEKKITRASTMRDRAKERVDEARMSGREPSKKQLDYLQKAEQDVEELKNKAAAQRQRAMDAQKLQVFPGATKKADDDSPTTALEMKHVNMDPKIIDQLSNKVSEGKATPAEARALEMMSKNLENQVFGNKDTKSDLNLENIKNQFSGLSDLKKPDFNLEKLRGDWFNNTKEASAEDVIKLKEPFSEPSRELINKSDLNLKSQLLQISSAIGITNENRKKNAEHNLVGDIKEPQVSKLKEDREIVIKVTAVMDGDYNIQLRPAVENIIGAKWKLEP